MNDKTFFPKIKFIFLFIIILIFSMHAQDSEELFILGNGFISINGVKNEVVIEKGILYNDTYMKYDTVLWVEKREKVKPLLYPQLFSGEGIVIHFTARNKKTPDIFYEFFIELNDTLSKSYRLSTASARVIAIKNGVLHPIPYVMKNLSGELIILNKKQKDYEITLYFNLQQRTDNQLENIDFRASFLLPTSKYRESDVISPIVKKSKQKIYKRNMQLAGVMVMLFLALFFFK